MPHISMSNGLPLTSKAATANYSADSFIFFEVWGPTIIYPSPRP